MKRNFIAILVGSLVIVTPMFAKLAVAQTSSAPFSETPKAGLTQPQRAQLEQKRQQLQSQIRAIITPEQRQQFATAIEQGQSIQDAIASLNLSAEQKAQLQQVRASSGLPNLSQLNLTQAQKTQLQQVSTQVRTQVEQILTTEQRQQFKAALVQGSSLREAIASLNLSAEQKSQLRQVMQSTRPQLNQILTAEQKQQLRQSLTSLRQQRQR
jgi:periplasmic protein CpxP/Spy